MPTPFKKGNVGGRGGYREGSGRKPDEFREKCRELANSPAMLQWLQDIVDGKIQVDPDVRLKAWDRLTDRGYGKPLQQTEEMGQASRLIIVRSEDLKKAGVNGNH